jgi:hypothetical protein
MFRLKAIGTAGKPLDVSKRKAKVGIVVTMKLLRYKEDYSPRTVMSVISLAQKAVIAMNHTTL